MFFGIVIIILLYITDLAKFKGAWWSGKSPQCLKLSNSGNALKIWLPQNGIKAICKWINNPFAVTIPNIVEIEIGNHGSNSIIVVSITHTFVIIVNEQRVDGSWLEKSWFSNTRPYIISQYFSHLRCTLRGFERNYQVLSLSKQIHTYRCYTTFKDSLPVNKINLALTSSAKEKINPWFVTGFVDGEGSFHVSVRKNPNYKLDWRVESQFKLTQHERDKALLEEIKNYIRVGQIYFNKKNNAVIYTVTSKRDLGIIIKFFRQYKLQTKKRADFQLWMQACELSELREHLTLEGFHKIVAIRASMNRGLSEELKLAFPHVVPVVRPLVENPKILDPNWLSGFTSAEGCFYVKLVKSQTHSIGWKVRLDFIIIQHTRDEQLMRIIIKYLDCGNIYKKRDTLHYTVYKFNDITDKIIPFFKKYPIRGVKALDFTDWCKVAELMQEKKHLTKKGLEQIRQIKAVMNTGRQLDQKR